MKVRWVACSLALTALLSGASPAAAELPSSVTVAMLTGVARPDGSFDNYQWHTGATAAWGLAARTELGGWGAGLEVWTNRTTQRIDATTTTLVRTTRIEAVASRKVFGFATSALHARLGTGPMMLGYAPDHVTLETGSGPVEVDLASIRTWTGGVGLAYEGQVAGDWSAGFTVDYRMFSLDTAHREGDAIVTSREAFGDWSARFEFARRFTLR